MPAARWPELAEKARVLVEQEKLSYRDAGARLGVTRHVLYQWAKRFGWKTNPSGPKQGLLNPLWKGGPTHGKIYRHLYRPEHPYATKGGKVAVHRLVYEAKIRRYLLPSEVVHHIDGNSLNNDPANLQHFQTNAHHLAHELKGTSPKWSADGRIQLAIARQKMAANRRGSKLYDHHYIQPTDRPTS
jgi:hypothetical protein